MEYTVNKLGKLSGVSSRTLRYYDEIDLLKPERINSSGYRIYGQKQVDQLQQILFYRQLRIPLDAIKTLIMAPDFNQEQALADHLVALEEKRSQLDTLIENVKKTMSATKGEIKMSDKEKFEGFKEKLIEDNEEKYGEEARQRYGEATVDASNRKISKMSTEAYAELEKLNEALNRTLKEACKAKDPSTELAQKACRLHKEWLAFYWPEYNKEVHLNLVKMYVADARFKAYYDNIVEGGAEFLLEALKLYLKD